MTTLTTFINTGQVECLAPVLDNMDVLMECAVDVAINGVDFTDAGVVFTYHGFQPVTCTPLCGPRKGGNQVRNKDLNHNTFGHIVRPVSTIGED